HILRLRHVKLVARFRVAHRELVERADAVTEPFPGDKKRCADVETEGVVLEGRPVPISHQEPDQPFVGLVHLRLVAGKADTRAVRAAHGGALVAGRAGRPGAGPPPRPARPPRTRARGPARPPPPLGGPRGPAGAPAGRGPPPAPPRAPARGRPPAAAGRPPRP